jgi:hypothetical protein
MLRRSVVSRIVGKSRLVRLRVSRLDAQAKIAVRKRTRFQFLLKYLRMIEFGFPFKR